MKHLMLLLALVSSLYAEKVCVDVTSDDGDIITECRMISHDGKLISINRYSGGKLNGMSEYYDEDERLTLERSYVDGVLSGTTKAYCENKLCMSVHYRNGEISGFLVIYDYTVEPIVIIDNQLSNNVSISYISFVDSGEEYKLMTYLGKSSISKKVDGIWVSAVDEYAKLIVSGKIFEIAGKSLDILE